MVNGERVELQLFTTLECNKQCKYCSEEVGNVRNSQNEISYTIDQLDLFVKTHFQDKEIIVTFYGGEPLINMKFIEDIIDRFPLWRYQLQTNGTLLDKLKPSVLGQLDSILISIDGDEKSTDEYRGKGTYENVITNTDYIRDKTQAYLTARVTWAAPQADILHLSSLFDYVYFQFPHTGWLYTPEHVRDMKSALTFLVDEFMSKGYMNIIPLMGFVRNILFPSRAKELYSGKTQCRVSSHLFNILPDGTITSCPDYVYNKKMNHGSVIENKCEKSPLQYSDLFPCKKCIAFDVCRMNCIKGLHQCFIEGDTYYKETALDASCSMIRHMYRLFTEYDLVKWYTSLSMDYRRELLNCPIYEYVEIMP